VKTEAVRGGENRKSKTSLKGEKTISNHGGGAGGKKDSPPQSGRVKGQGDLARGTITTSPKKKKKEKKKRISVVLFKKDRNRKLKLEKKKHVVTK